MDSHKLNSIQYLYDHTSSDDESLNMSMQKTPDNEFCDGITAEIDDLKDIGDINESCRQKAQKLRNKKILTGLCPIKKHNSLLNIPIEKESEKGAMDNTLANPTKEIPAPKDRPSACVFVASLSSNLPDDILCKTVTEHFKQWGNVTFVKVLRDLANRPYAFVQYGTDKEASKAIKEGQHSVLNNRTIRCEKARVNRTLFVHASDYKKVNINEFRSILETYGEVEKLIPVEPHFKNTKDSEEFNQSWFAKFVYRQDAINAFASLKLKDSWRVEWAQNLDDEYKNTPDVTIDRYSIFVGHLDPRIKKSELIERFELHGKIKEAILVSRPVHNFAFIKFVDRDAAAAAVERENHSLFKYKTIYVQYREVYNNAGGRKKRINLSIRNGIRLNLAPPPVNFKRHVSIRTGQSMSDFKYYSYGAKQKFDKWKKKVSTKSLNFNPLSANDKLIMYSEFQNIPSACVPRILGQIDPLSNTENVCAGSSFGIPYQSSCEKICDVDLCGPSNEFDQRTNMTLPGKACTKKDDETIRSTNTDHSCEQKSLYTLNTEESSENASKDNYSAQNFQFNQAGSYRIPYYYLLPQKGINYIPNNGLQMGLCEPSTPIGVPGFSPVSSSSPNANASGPNFMLSYPGLTGPSQNTPPSMLYPFYMYYCNNIDPQPEANTFNVGTEAKERSGSLSKGSL